MHLSINDLMIRHRHIWIEGLRVFLGGLLCYRGYYFVENLSEIYVIIEDALPVSAFIIAHYVVFAHLVGGLLLAIGLLTRLAALIQIPVLIGAVFFVRGMGFFGPATELEYSLLVLVLLVVFFFYGAGKWSVDHRILRQEEDSGIRIQS
ncbi:MAG: DoxX family membrane protein [Balneolales bacterium]